jgi:hypothetical protein
MYDMTSVQEQTALRYPCLSDQTRTRWQTLLASNRQQLTERVKQFLQLGIEACEHHGPNLVQARWTHTTGCLWICCEQSHLAELMSCSVKTIGNTVAALKSLGALRVVPHPTKPNVCAYRIHLETLESLLESFTPDLDEIIFAFEELRLADPIADTVAERIAEPISEPVADLIAEPVAGLMNHDHEGLNEIINSSITHDQDSHDARGPERRARFDDISDRDIRGIAGFAVEINGRTGTASESSRLKKLREYFDDAVQAGLAAPEEFRLFAALFRCVGRRSDVKFRPRYLRTLWTNRNEKPLEGVVTTADREYVRRLLECAQLVPH